MSPVKITIGFVPRLAFSPVSGFLGPSAVAVAARDAHLTSPVAGARLPS